MRRLLMLVLLVVAITGSAFSQRAQSVSTRVKVGDTITISLGLNKAYGGDFVVLDDGSIQGRGFGRIIVDGLTIDQVRRLVNQRLSRTVRNPETSVFVRSQRPNLVYVAGTERTNGPTPITPGLDLRALLATQQLPGNSDDYEVTLYRRGARQYHGELSQLLRGGDAGAMKVEADDSVYITPKPTVRVWFYGEVTRTGETRLPEGADVYKGLASMGGPLRPAGDQGALLEDQQIVVKRGNDTVRVLPARPSPQEAPFILEAGDIVYVQSPARAQIEVTGEVISPGMLTVRQDTPINAVVAQAKGTTPEGTLSNVTVFRGTETFVFDATAPLKGETGPKFTFQSGDLVVVRRTERVVFVFGEVKRPGRIVVPDGQNFSLSDAIAQAGDLNDRGTYRRIAIARPDKNGRLVRQFNLDEYMKDGKLAANPPLMPGDVVLVGQPKGITLSGGLGFFSNALLLRTLLR